MCLYVILSICYRIFRITWKIICFHSLNGWVRMLNIVNLIRYIHIFEENLVLLCFRQSLIVSFYHVKWPSLRSQSAKTQELPWALPPGPPPGALMRASGPPAVNQESYARYASHWSVWLSFFLKSILMPVCSIHCFIVGCLYLFFFLFFLRTSFVLWYLLYKNL